MSRPYRIEDIRTAVINGRRCKTFRAFRRVRGGYRFAGQFSAPVGTPDSDLHLFVPED